jgi:hypothetical protein
VQGSPGGEGAEQDNLDAPSHRILGSYRDGEMNSGKPDNVRKSPENPIITKSQTTPPPHHANRITPEDSPHRLPKGGDRAKILQGRGAKALKGSVPEVAPASSRKGWSRPWSGRGGKGTVRIPTTLGP